MNENENALLKLTNFSKRWKENKQNVQHCFEEPFNLVLNID